MQDQITVRLTADLSLALQRASRRLRRRRSDVVRMAIEALLQGETRTDQKPADRVRGLLGSLSTGVPDLAERHRDYVIESLRRGR